MIERTHKLYLLLLLQYFGKSFRKGAAFIEKELLPASLSCDAISEWVSAFSKTALSPTPEEIARAMAKVDSLLKRVGCGEFSILLREDKNFPPSLLKIGSPPFLLYLSGCGVLPPEEKSTTVIGCRNPSQFGFQEGKRVAAEVAEGGDAVVSGLASGCDTAAHLGALAQGGITVAALPCGFDCIFPRNNQGLANKIVANKGFLISEYPPDAPALPYRFVMRDRLQSSLSRKIVVIETDRTGGTLHTVKFARKEKKKLYILNTHQKEQRDFPTFRGNLMLLERGWGRPYGDDAPFNDQEQCSLF